MDNWKSTLAKFFSLALNNVNNVNNVNNENNINNVNLPHEKKNDCKCNGQDHELMQGHDYYKSQEHYYDLD